MGGGAIEQQPCAREATGASAYYNDVFMFALFYPCHGVDIILFLHEVVGKNDVVSAIFHERKPSEEVGVQLLPSPIRYNHSISPKLHIHILLYHLHHILLQHCLLLHSVH